MKNLSRLFCFLFLLSFTNDYRSQSNVCFSSISSYKTDGQCVKVYDLADMDNDGDLDLIGSGAASWLKVQMGLGTGNFNTAVNYTYSGSNSISNAMASDFNNDGNKDIVYTYGSTVAIALGSATGSLVAFQSFTVPTGVTEALAVGDFNNDNNKDIAVINFAGQLYILLGTGTGSISAVNSFAVGSNVGLQIGVGDFNADGKLDISVPRSNGAGIVHGSGAGSFTVAPTVTSTVSSNGVMVDDVNNDGNPDLIVTKFTTQNLEVFLGSATGSFSLAGVFSCDGYLTKVKIKDMNNDGKKDIITQNTSSRNITVMRGDGLGNFNSKELYGIEDQFFGIAVGDINNDLYADAILGGQSSFSALTFFTNTGSYPTFKAVPNFYAGGVARTIISVDFNNDGKPDLASAETNNVRVLLGVGTASFGASTIYTVPYSPTITKGDFNGDGNIDIATGNFHASLNLSILLGTGTGSFGAAINTSVAGISWGINAADLNNDGKTDIVISAQANNSVSVLLATSNGSFSPPVNYPTGSDPRGLAINDLNNDGILDIVCTNNVGANGLTVLLGIGAGAFSTPTNVASFMTLQNLVIVDVNNDGNKDVVAGKINAGFVLLFLGNGSGGFAAPSMINVAAFGSPGCADIVSGDFNSDGKVDIAIADYGNNDLSVLVGNGSGGFTQKSFVAAYDARAITTAHLNNDTKLDIVILETDEFTTPANSSFALLFNNTAGITASGPTTFCVGGDVTLSASSNAYSYLWNPGAVTTQTLFVTTAGVYTVTLSDPAGFCNSNATQTVVVTVCAGIEETKLNENAFNIFPNPNNGSFVVATDGDDIVSVCNELGQHIQTIRLDSSNNYSSSVSGLSQGIYFLKGNRVKGKVIVLK